MCQSNSKAALWHQFVDSNRVIDQAVPLFACCNGTVETMCYGRDQRQVLKRSDEMTNLMRTLGTQLVNEYRDNRVVSHGILYIMFDQSDGVCVPLYIGKAELFGKGEQNLSVNISDLVSGDGKFGRWGYNYAYHLGDLSAATLSGHAKDKRQKKYEDWRDAMFEVGHDKVRAKSEIKFWATAWNGEQPSIWRDYGATRLAFEEYLLIGVASDAFPNRLLNREGRNR